jgi:hypothetical protein
MQPVPRILSGTPITQELLDSLVRAIHELQGHAITGVNYPLMRAGGTLSALDNVTQALAMVQNDTGGDLDTGAVVGLDGPLEDAPTTAPLAFQNSELTFSGIAPADPDHVGKFAVLVDPIPTGAVGRACIQGVVRVQVQIDDADVADWADIDDGETGNLLAAASGSARILWRDGTGAGTAWCICLIGCGGAGADVGVGQNDYEVYQTRTEGGVKVAAWDYARLHSSAS